ncbi:uncharacterized protein LOC134444351 [Engraulis encrasicolus]|uniref:uncharacterized protein LOC134444351 n=1 Tax=Engraulis encrasicolus TaxID=184585 RepID=UPI002FCEA80D
MRSNSKHPGAAKVGMTRRRIPSDGSVSVSARSSSSVLERTPLSKPRASDPEHVLSQITTDASAEKLQKENADLKKQLEDLRCQYQQLLEEGKEETLEKRRVNLLKAQVMQLERQVVLLSEGLSAQVCRCQDVERALDPLLERLKSLLSSDAQGGAEVCVARSELTQLVERCADVRQKLHRKVKATSVEDLSMPWLLTKSNLVKQPVTLLDLCYGKTDNLNLQRVSALESRLCQLFKHLHGIRQTLGLLLAPAARGGAGAAPGDGTSLAQEQEDQQEQEQEEEEEDDDDQHLPSRQHRHQQQEEEKVSAAHRVSSFSGASSSTSSASSHRLSTLPGISSSSSTPLASYRPIQGHTTLADAPRLSTPSGSSSTPSATPRLSTLPGSSTPSATPRLSTLPGSSSTPSATPRLSTLPGSSSTPSATPYRPLRSPSASSSRVLPGPWALYARLLNQAASYLPELESCCSDLMVLSLLRPSAPWRGAGHQEVSLELCPEEVLACLPAFPRGAPQQRARRAAEALCTASRHAQTMAHTQVEALQAELEFHRALYRLQVTYTEELIEGVRQAYIAFQDDVTHTLCTPLQDVLSCYADLRRSASEESLRSFLTAFKSRAPLIQEAVGALHPSHSQGSEALSRYGEQFLGEVQRVLGECGQRREVAAGQLEVLRREQEQALDTLDSLSQGRRQKRRSREQQEHQGGHGGGGGGGAGGGGREGGRGSQGSGGGFEGLPARAGEYSRRGKGESVNCHDGSEMDSGESGRVPQEFGKGQGGSGRGFDGPGSGLDKHEQRVYNRGSDRPGVASLVGASGGGSGGSAGGSGRGFEQRGRSASRESQASSLIGSARGSGRSLERQGRSSRETSRIRRGSMEQREEDHMTKWRRTEHVGRADLEHEGDSEGQERNLEPLCNLEPSFRSLQLQDECPLEQQPQQQQKYSFASEPQRTTPVHSRQSSASGRQERERSLSLSRKGSTGDSDHRFSDSIGGGPSNAKLPTLPNASSRQRAVRKALSTDMTADTGSRRPPAQQPTTTTTVGRVIQRTARSTLWQTPPNDLSSRPEWQS